MNHIIGFCIYLAGVCSGYCLVYLAAHFNISKVFKEVCQAREYVQAELNKLSLEINTIRKKAESDLVKEVKLQ